MRTGCGGRGAFGIGSSCIANRGTDSAGGNQPEGRRQLQRSGLREANDNRLSARVSPHLHDSRQMGRPSASGSAGNRTGADAPRHEGGIGVSCGTQHRLFLALVTAAAATGALAAPAPAVDPVAPQTSGGQRNERVCETITVTGSRLGAKRFCGTRAEWEERRLRDRQEVEKAQRMPCVVNGTTCK